MSTSTVHRTMAQAVVRFLQNQYSERDGNERGIFGHGNISGRWRVIHGSGGVSPRTT